MNQDTSQRDILHELGNVQQEKVALQYLLTIAAEQIEALAAKVSDPDDRKTALETAMRLRRSAEL